ncbi:MULTISPECIES: hypothetical protein [unclassified Caballeronia]|uniref:hypothetical protein n=1 Tax=unclassified Caballeronia TaxID=2646786 RepID=UPI002859456F|nr:MULTISPECIES: hypothetical protein [unclassified Caballeronia]MDR5750211.1 hypothetical protein [Caballeronia sp. LZ024]MDR5842660.1 hypothetical protein [Caballeronia sp. LZ031]
MTAYLCEKATPDKFAAFERTSLSSAEGHNERWLQERLFISPKLVPMTEMFGHGEDFVPLCRGLPLRYGASNVFLDLLGVSPTGKLVLIECKLWRNPEARREVIAQLFEYASLLADWSYSDLEARLKQARGMSGENPIFRAVHAMYPDLSEARFVDSVSESLRTGNFLLAIAGDGIRSDLQSLRSLLATRDGLLASLALLEIQLYRDAEGRTLLVPCVPVKSEVIAHRVVTRANGTPLTLESADSLATTAPVANSKRDSASSIMRLANRALWDLFISSVRFDHPDQPPPRHGGNNYVRIDLPGPVSGLVAYRTADRATGFMLKFVGEEGRETLQRLLEDQTALEAELGHELVFEVGTSSEGDGRVVGELRIDWKPSGSVNTDDAQLEWLRMMANSAVNALRPRLGS